MRADTQSVVLASPCPSSKWPEVWVKSTRASSKLSTSGVEAPPPLPALVVVVPEVPPPVVDDVDDVP